MSSSPASYVTACVNGTRTPDQRPTLPVTPGQLAAAAVRTPDGPTAADDSALVSAAVQLLSR